MTNTPMYLSPGVCMVDSNYSLSQPFNFVAGRYAKGRWANGNLYRFTAGFPEKIGGWISFLNAGLIGIVRCQRPWLDYAGAVEIGIGTESHLYAYNSGVLNDITPKNLISQGTLTNPFSTTNGSPVVAVADAANHLVNGDWVFLNSPANVGGLTIDGYYIISSRTGTGYNINAGLNATSTSPTVGGTTAFNYPRYNLTNPFAMTSGSPVVTVTDNAHAAATGDYVTFSGATAYNGITVNGQYQLTVLTANTYTITAGNNASGSGAAGGGTVSTVHNVSFGSEQLSVPTNYGTGPYGTGPFGYSFSSVSIGQPNWSLAPYGNLLLANPVGGTIYIYDPKQGGVAFPLLNAPSGILAMFVTPERFIIALGNTSSPLQMSWPDQSVITQWVSTAVNTANSGRTVQGGSVFVSGRPVAPGMSLFWSDRSVFALEYTGDAEVYNSPLLADNAGLLAPNAAVAEGGVCYWMGDRDFWSYNGSVSSLPSDDIRDFVYNQKNLTSVNYLFKNKTTAGFNRQKREVWFFYVSQSSTEVDSYVIYHYDQQCWSTGTLQRTSWIDSELLTAPISSDALGNLFNQEQGTDADGAAMNSWVQTGPIDITNGDTSMDISEFIPDFERLVGTVNLSVLTRYYPQDTDTVDGPYPISAVDQNPIVDLRSDGRTVAALLSSNEIGGDFRLGLFRFDIKPAGARS